MAHYMAGHAKEGMSPGIFKYLTWVPNELSTNLLTPPPSLLYYLQLHIQTNTQNLARQLNVKTWSCHCKDFGVEKVGKIPPGMSKEGREGGKDDWSLQGRES